MTAVEEDNLAAQADALLAAHHGSKPLVLPNVWDAASVRIVEEAGFPFIATSSRAVAGVLGTQDNDSSDPDVIFDFIGRITGAVSCPVTADLEAGYRLDPADLVARLLGCGAVGCNLEDTDHHSSDGVLVDADKQAGFIAAVRAAADTAGVHVVINARVDTFIRAVGDKQDQVHEAIRRGHLYLAAGADCVYPIVLGDRDRIAQITAALPGPVNISLRRDGLSIDELAALSVRRISLMAGLHQMVGDHLSGIVRRLADEAGVDHL